MKEEQKSAMTETGKLIDTSSVLEIRLHTKPILDQFETFVTGKQKFIVYDSDGKPFVQEIVLTPPKANKLGQQVIINKVQNIINSAVVQGNFDEAKYEHYIDKVWGDLIDDLMINLYIWGIKIEDYNPLIDHIIDILIPFISRLLENKERESYAQSLRVSESSNITQLKNRVFGGG